MGGCWGGGGGSKHSIKQACVSGVSAGTQKKCEQSTENLSSPEIACKRRFIFMFSAILYFFELSVLIRMCYIVDLVYIQLWCPVSPCRLGIFVCMTQSLKKVKN